MIFLSSHIEISVFLVYQRPIHSVAAMVAPLVHAESLGSVVDNVVNVRDVVFDAIADAVAPFSEVP